MIDMRATMGEALTLPYKPFTADEVFSITGVDQPHLDKWIIARLPLSVGCGVTGLSMMQTFAVFVGSKWIGEGADEDRAAAVVEYVGTLSEQAMRLSFETRRSYPVPRQQLGPVPRRVAMKHGMLIACPDTNLGRRLCMRPMWDEFLSRLERAFPNQVARGG